MPVRPLLLASLLLAACASEPDPLAEPTAEAETEATAEEAPDEKQLFGRDFASVCRGTAGQPTAAEYVAGGGLHPFLILTSTDGIEFSSTSVGRFPDGWQATWPDLANAQLVVCAVRTSATPAQLCAGYEDDDSGNTWSVRMHEAAYTYTVRNAQKGDVLGTQTFEVPAARCPSFSMYREGDPDPKPYVPRPRDAEVEVFLQPFVTGG